MTLPRHRVVIVGGGAGGLELATRLGDSLGRSAEVTLIERNRTHVWKPKLHAIAAGSMDIAAHEVDYLAQAHRHRFRYRIGEMTGLDRRRREVHVAAYHDADGREVTPRRSFGYDTLVLAVGSNSNDFRTPGVGEHAMKLESQADARRFHAAMVNACIRANAQTTPLRPEQLKVAIIGAGATGVELAAELHRTTRQVVAQGLDRVDANKDITVNLIEAADRVLPALPPRLSKATLKLLSELGVRVHTNACVAEVLRDGVRLADGRMLPAELVVWAAGVKAPDFLQDLAGLESNRINQLVVRPTLQTTRDDDVFAMGDCAACPWADRGTVPPRAQAALDLLTKLGVQVHTNARVAEVLRDGVRLADGRVLPAELVVWAAGVKAPNFLQDLAGLESNRINQLVVRPTLQTTRDDNVFAMGDCAACPWVGRGTVPPRAQAAHQQAGHLYRQIRRRLAGKPLRAYTYRDFGSLVSLGEFSTVGNMMGGLIGGSLMIEGTIARLMYLWLYKMHELALHSPAKVALDSLARLIAKRTAPPVKLH